MQLVNLTKHLRSCFQIELIRNFFFNFHLAITTDKDTLDDLNEHLDTLLPKLMELTPSDQSKFPIIAKRLKEFYLNGSNIVKDANVNGFIKVREI